LPELFTTRFWGFLTTTRVPPMIETHFQRIRYA
jgi:hypothetical protein